MTEAGDPFAEFTAISQKQAPQTPSKPNQGGATAPRPSFVPTAAPATTVRQPPASEATASEPGHEADVEEEGAQSRPTRKPDEEERVQEERGAARDILLGVYIDPEMDALVERYASRRIEGTRKRPSRSAVGYWLMALGMEALKQQGQPPMPRDVTKRRPHGE